MVLAIADKWIWDFWLYRDADLWHAYFLQADKNLVDSNLRHRNVTQGHATSRDLVNWTHLGTCLEPSTARPAFDDWTTWTGSVVRDTDRIWHLFYTGTSHSGVGLLQRIGHAESLDGHHWQRVGGGLALDLNGDPRYEEYAANGTWPDRAMRDPWVMRAPNGNGWWMYFTARVPGREEPNAGGAIGFATSPDLYTWTLQKPVYTGGRFGQMEVPQVFKHGRYWYCVFCTEANHWSEAYKWASQETPVTGTHYLVALDPLGPWEVAPGPFLDGALPCERYAGKVIETGNGLALLAFRYWDKKGKFIGDVCDPIPITVDSDGLLHAHPGLAGM